MKEKMSLRERLTEASSTGKVTMVEWNKAWQKFTRSRDVYQTLSQIEATGNRAFYHSIDVTDAEALHHSGRLSPIRLLVLSTVLDWKIPNLLLTKRGRRLTRLFESRSMDGAH